MTFDLLSNPFAVLGVSAHANRTAILSAYDDALFDDDSPARERVLDNARQALFSPRPRLDAEIGFFPGADQPTIETIIGDLKASGPTEAADTLTGLERANYLAHRCAFGSPDARERMAKALVHAYGDVSPEATSTTLSRARQKSGFGDVDFEAVKQAVARLRERHAACALEALCADSHGPENAAKLAGDLVAMAGPRGDFVAAVLTCYESKFAGQLEQLAAEAKTALQMVGANSSDAELSEFERALSNWDRIAQPLQLADQARGIDEAHSRELFEAVREHCIDLNNEGHYAISLAAIRIAREVFAELPDAVGRLDQDVSILRGNLEHAGRQEKLRPLTAGIEGALADLKKFAHDVRNRGCGSNAKPRVAAVMIPLRQLLKDADLETRGEAAGLVRSLAIQLHNTAEDSMAALALTDALRDEAERLPQELADQLAIDRNTLQRNLGFAALGEAVKNRRLGQAKKLAEDLLENASPQESAELWALKGRIEDSQRGTRNQFIGWGVFIAFIIIVGMFNSSPSSTRSIDNSYPSTYPTDSYTPDPAITVEAPSDASQTESSDPANSAATASSDPSETPPAISYASATVSLPELRYCVHQKARLQAVQSDSLTPEQTDRFNSAVDDFNSRCSNVRYLESDMRVVESEDVNNQDRLRSEGDGIIDSETN